MSEVVVAPPVSPTTRARAATRELWLDRLARFPSSGLTVAQFSPSRPFPYPPSTSGNAASLPRPRRATTQNQGRDLGPRLLSVRLQPSAPAVELVLTTGAVLRLPPGCDLAWVRSLVAVLGEPSC